MASKSEMESEHRRDTEQWSHRVVRAMKEYREAEKVGNLSRRATAFVAIRGLVKEKMDLGYDFDDIDPFGVSKFSEDDKQMLINLEEKMTHEEEMER